jgi:hypothetical protein
MATRNSIGKGGCDIAGSLSNRRIFGVVTLVTASGGCDPAPQARPIDNGKDEMHKSGIAFRIF